MAKKTYAIRYAKAVFEIALETGQPEQWQADLRQIAAAAEDAALVAALESPKLRFEDKDRLLGGRLKGISPLAMNLARLLVSRGNLSIIAAIAGEYQKLLDSYHGIEAAEVATAVPLDEADASKLAEFLGSIAGKKVVVKTSVDPALLGGFTARMGGKLLDGSTRSKLVALKRQLAGTGRKL